MAGFNYAQNIIGLKNSGGGDIKELELEVAQLSASVLTIGEKVENATTYSTDEKIVGKWVDGSDLYEKTIQISNPTSGDDVGINHNIPNINQIIYYFGCGILPGGVAYVNYADSGYYIELHEVNRTKTMWKIGASIASQIDHLLATIRYTKTTT